MDLKQIAQALQLAQKIREDSWDESSARYRVTEMDACIQTCVQLKLPIAFSVLLDLSLHWSNDIQEWCIMIEKDNGAELEARIRKGYNEANPEDPLP